jgi:hypothetical protein
MRGKKLSFAISVLVCLGALGSGIALAVQDEGEGGSATSPSAEGESSPSRTADSETLSLPSGQLETRIYPDPVNYQDEEGNWQPIGERLHETGEGTLTNGPNGFDITLPKQIDSKPVRFEVGDQWIESQLQRKDLEGAELEGGTATYEGEGNAPSFEFTGLGNGLKEGIELSGAGQASTYAYELGASEGLTPSLANDGSVRFEDSEGTAVVILPAPVMTDNAGAESRDVHYELGPEEEGRWKLSVVADREWLQQPDRAFPVVIDPTMTVKTALNCTIGGKKGEAGWIDCAAWGRKDLLLGYTPKINEKEDNWWRSLIEFETDAVPANSEISSATFNIHSLEVAQNTKGVELRKTTKPWNWEASWSRYDATHLWTTEGGDYSESLGEVLTATRGTGIGWWQFNLPTKTVEAEVNAEEWLQTILKLVDDKVRECGKESCTARKVDFDSSAATTEANRPYLSVVYKAPAPIVTTEATSGLSETGVTLKGQVNPHGYATTYQFEYGTTTSYGTKVPATAESIGSGKTNVTVGKAITGLKGATTYHYRVSATNAFGTSAGEDKTFRTPKLPTATTEAAVINEAGVALKGTVTPYGPNVSFQFEYGTTTSYGSAAPSSPASISSESSPVAVSETMKGLSPGTTYHYRLRATSPPGSSLGVDKTFTAPSPPTVVTGPSANTNTATGTLLGTVNPNRLESAFYFEYGPTTAYGSKTPSVEGHVGPGENPIPVSGTTGNLTSNTVYHYRLVARNQIGTTYGEDKTIIADQIKPSMTFASTYSAAAPNQYGLEVQASDSGTVHSGLKSISLLLNGSTVASESMSCPANTCPSIAKLNWTHTFGHALDGSDRLTVLTLDAAGNATSTAFDLPSQVVHAVTYTGNPASGGSKIADEWTQLHTHDSRLQESNETVTRGTAECLQAIAEGQCSFLRTESASKQFSEVSTPISKPLAISEAGALSLPGQTDFGQSVASGPISEIRQSWQVLPPGAGTTYEKLVSNNVGDETNHVSATEWIFWVDSATKLPIKESRKEGSEAPRVSYFSYDTSLLEAGELSTNFFLLPPPTRAQEGCIPQGHLGGWSYNEAGLTYPDPRFNSLVNTGTGPVILRPEGAAIDGYDPRAKLTSSGVELLTTSPDEQALHWEVVESPDQSLETAGSSVVVISEGGTPSAVIASTVPKTMSVVDGSPHAEYDESGDEIVLQPSAGANAEVQSIVPERNYVPCITKSISEGAALVHEEAEAAGIVMSKPSGFASKTTTIGVWVNPHPALSGVAVTDKYGRCTGPSTKTVGSDGHVEWGGCPVGSSVTITVPHEVSAGGNTYVVSDSSRTISPPSNGWTMSFDYNAQASGGGEGSPPPPTPAKPLLGLEVATTNQEDEAEESPAYDLQVPPQYDCFGKLTRPYKSDTAVPNLFTAEGAFRFKCRPGSFLDSWFFNWRLDRWNEDERYWANRSSKSVGGRGPAITQQGPYYISAACRGNGVSLNDPTGKSWRNGGTEYGTFEKPGGVEVVDPIERNAQKTFPCG